MKSIISWFGLIFGCAMLPTLQESVATGLYFREDFKPSPPATPITQDHVAHSQLRMHLYGPGNSLLKKSHHEEKPGDPFYAWSGQCTGPWAIAFSRLGKPADLSGQEARVRMTTMNFTGLLDDHPNGAAILQHPRNPTSPEPWILRDARRPTNMQNSKWPGRTPFVLPREKPVVLKYRLLIHNGADLGRAYSEYIRDSSESDVRTSRN